MKNTTPPKNWIKLIAFDGGIVAHFDGFDHLVACYPNIWHYRISPDGKRDCSGYDWSTWSSFPKYEYFLRDSFGDIVSIKDVKDAHLKAERKKRWDWWRNYMPGRKYGNHHYRRIKTFNERKQIDRFKDEEFVPKVRCARNENNLAEGGHWSEPQQDWSCRKSWKKYRKHQWKEKH